MRWAIFSTFILFSAVLIFVASCDQVETKPEFDHKYSKYPNSPTPVFNTLDLRKIFGGRDGCTLKTDKKGLIRELETILLPGEPIKILEEINVGDAIMLRIESPAYPYPTKKGYYVDSRFLQQSSAKLPWQRDVFSYKIPTRGEIIKNLLEMNGARYVWGGNYYMGIPEMLKFYPPAKQVNGITASRWMLKGVDCSGLLYQATNGMTPRNTSSLVSFGEPVQIAGLSADEIIAKLEPLDIIVWDGHVVIVLNKKQTIESSISPAADTGLDGVRICLLKKRLKSILKKRTAVNNCSSSTPGRKFVIRRWLKPKKSDVLLLSKPSSL